MDPDTTLIELRTLTGLILAGGQEAASTFGAELAEHFDALDGWLTKGGFFPTAWAKSVRPYPVSAAYTTDDELRGALAPIGWECGDEGTEVTP